MLSDAITSFELHVLATSHLEVAITEAHRVVFVHLSLQLIVARETVRLWEDDDLLDGADLGRDVEDLENVVLGQRSVALHAQHLETQRLQHYVYYKAIIKAISSDIHQLQFTCYTTLYNIIKIFDTVVRQKKNFEHEYMNLTVSPSFHFGMHQQGLAVSWHTSTV